VLPGWIRERFSKPSGRPAYFGFVALLDDPRIDDALERARDEVGDPRLYDRLTVDLVVRANDGGRLDEALSGRGAFGLEARDEHERHEIARCPKYVVIEARLADSRSLALLEAALATLRALATEGNLLFAVDQVTARWWTPAELAALPPDRPFDLDEHAQVVVEAVERAPGVGHLVRSRGLGKLARPDVGARAPRRDASLLAEIVRDLARLLAHGEQPAPGDLLRVPNLPPLTLVPRTDDCLHDAPAASAPLYELRDRGPDPSPGPDLRELLAALRPKPRLKVLR
jgi:hypothetical protein